MLAIGFGEEVWMYKANEDFSKENKMRLCTLKDVPVNLEWNPDGQHILVRTLPSQSKIIYYDAKIGKPI